MNSQPFPESLPILGIPVTLLDSYDSAITQIRTYMASRRRTFCVAINPAKIHEAHRDPRLRRIINSAQLHICDGAGIALAAGLLHHRVLRRCTGIELFSRMIRLAEQERWKIFLLGASAQSNSRACRKLLETCPSLQIAGHQDGYFKDSAEVVAAINASGADALFVAMGSPRQELWIGEHLPQLNVRFCMGVGGSLDVISGTVKRAPGLFCKTGTEWLYRALLQPSRIPRLFTNGLFVLDVLKAAFVSHGKELLTSR